MVNDIINGISNALYKNFEGVEIYSDRLEQGFKEPCFFILSLISSEDRLLGDRAKRTLQFDIHYFPKGDEIHEMEQNLYGVLRCIKLLNGDMLNGLKLHSEVVDRVLHFFVQYVPIIRYVGDEPETMENLQHETVYKE